MLPGCINRQQRGRQTARPGSSQMHTVDLSAPLVLEDLIAVGRGEARAVLGETGRARMERARALVDASLAPDGPTRYGINTGFGALAEVRIPLAQVRALQINLIRSHQTGVGDPLPREVVRIMTLLRAQVLARGHSGVRPLIVDRLCAMLAAGVHPVIPSQGSVGASGDLAPLAHLAAVLVGEGRAEFAGEVLPGAEAMALADIEPIELHAKEGLSLINGTQAMTAIATVALERAERAIRAADVAGALSVESLLASVRPFDARIQALRPYEGQARVAANLRAMTADSELVASHAGCGKVQDAYSLRCMPQVHGAVREAFAHVRAVLSVEINAVTDNPLILSDADGEVSPTSEIVSGGNFHGQPVAMVSDYARIALTSLASMAERRVEQMLNPHLNTGLPAFLAHDSGLHSGLMIAQVTAAALVSESKQLSMPASVDSIPSSASREDHVSMGPIAARRFLEVAANVERVVAIELLTACQAIDARGSLLPGTGCRAAWRRVRDDVAALAEDRPLSDDIEAIAVIIRTGALEAAVREAIGGGGDGLTADFGDGTV